MPYRLTADVGVKVGPVLLETAFKHFLAQRHGSDEFKAKDELLYDEAFHIVKTFMQTSTKHTVEELQQFSNARIPVPPWIHAPRVLVPMSCCDAAAKYIIDVLGGPEMAKKLVGGTKWWQVRGVQGVDGQWIAARKDWQEAKRKRKEYEAKHHRAPPPDPDDPSTVHEYTPEMDQMRCLLFAHGGGYFFGSIDQERYCMQRYARKMKGRVFAVGYRLAPQYPFPCALQDALAAYLYLIEPPPGAKHLPVPPSMIILGGSSAGGGLMLALLQVIRDVGLPPPAGAVLISPWCDLTHSFDSIHENTATDVIPSTGLSFLKPSALWPPPPPETHDAVRAGLKDRIKKLIHRDSHHHLRHAGDVPVPNAPAASGLVRDPSVQARSVRSLRHARSESDLHIAHDDKHRVAGDAPHPLDEDTDVTVVHVDGREIRIDTQIHLYAPNRLIKHPLVSPIMSYLGGLPPLFFIASDKEVLRDEIIYTAHKAARPDKYPTKDEARRIYPHLVDIESRYGPTKVHLQVYDDTCHVLPLFSFTTPAKFCYRAIATFCKYVTPDRSASRSTSTTGVPDEPQISPPGTPLITDGFVHTPEQISSPGPAYEHAGEAPLPASPTTPEASGGDATPPASPRPSSRRILSLNGGVFRRHSLLGKPQARRSVSLVATRKGTSLEEEGQEREDSGDVAGKRFGAFGHNKASGLAGDPSVYSTPPGAASPFVDNMIRERVSTLGVIRPLEDPSEIPALCKPPERVGVISEASAKRYLEARVAFDKRFGGTSKSVQRARSKHLTKASKESRRVMDALARAPVETLSLGTVSSWYLDADENPPPSSLVARRDTAEARRLGMIADQSLSQEETRLSGNSLWSAVANFLSTSPETEKGKAKAAVPPSEGVQKSPVLATNGVAVVHPAASNGEASAASPSQPAAVNHDEVGDSESSKSHIKKRRSSIFGVKDFLTRKSTIRPSVPAQS